MPYKNVGAVKNASTEVVMNLELDNDTANITVYSPIQLGDVIIKLAYDGNTVFEEKANISPTDIFTKSIPIPNIDETKLTLAVYKDGNKLLSYTHMGENDEETPCLLYTSRCV